jgi:integrase
VLEPILKIIGARKLRDLTAADVRQALAAMAAGYSSAAVTMGHLALKRAIRHAEANDLVARNVAALADTPKGQQGRPSKSLTLDQAAAVITTARTLPAMELRPGLKDARRPAELMHASIVLSLLTGIRTEEARALRWAHVDLDGDPAARPAGPPHVAVWRSVRAHGETKTERSRRTLGLPAAAVQALRAWSGSQADERRAAAEHWQDTAPVFTNHLGAALDAGNVRKMFKRICTQAGAGDGWTPRELRTTFVSLLSHRGVSIEEIARLAGHASSRTTEIIYRRELRPVITTGAEIMDELFTATAISARCLAAWGPSRGASGSLGCLTGPRPPGCRQGPGRVMKLGRDLRCHNWRDVLGVSGSGGRARAGGGSSDTHRRLPRGTPARSCLLPP